MKKIETFLFKNIGKTLKRFAIASFIIEAIAGIVTGIATAIALEEFIFLLISVAAPFAAYALSIFLYGFGELVDSTSSTAKASKETNQVIDADELPEL